MKNESCLSQNFVLFVCLTVLVVLALVGNLLIETKINAVSLPLSTKKDISLLQSEDNKSTRKHTQTYVAKPPVKTCIGAKIAILVKSSADHSEQRQVIRTTWASVHNVSGNLIRTIFLLGITENRTTNLLLTKEASENNDVIIGPFIDTYANLTLKSTFGLRWIREFCRQTNFVLLGDDDMYLKLPEIATHYLVKPHSEKRVLHCGGTLNRNPKVRRIGKWKVPLDYYKPSHYPAYCGGLCYIMSNDVVLSISLALNDTLTRIAVDDALLTGIIREQIGYTVARMPKGLCRHLLNAKNLKEKLIKVWQTENNSTDKKVP